MESLKIRIVFKKITYISRFPLTKVEVKEGSTLGPLVGPRLSKSTHTYFLTFAIPCPYTRVLQSAERGRVATLTTWLRWWIIEFSAQNKFISQFYGLFTYSGWCAGKQIQAASKPSYPIRAVTMSVWAWFYPQSLPTCQVHRRGLIYIEGNKKQTYVRRKWKINTSKQSSWKFLI